MSWIRFFRRAEWDRMRAEELESYIDAETEENIGRGMTRDAACLAARRKLGNRTRIREEIYGMNSIAFFDTLVHDVRFALRALRHNPAFTVVALLTIAIGIGANTAVFSVVNSVLLRPLKYPDSERLVALRQTAPGAPGLASFSDGLLLSASMFVTYSEHNRTFQSLGVYYFHGANATGIGEPEQVRTAVVSDGLLQALDVPALLGRWLNAHDQIPEGSEAVGPIGRSHTVMLSYGYWQPRFGGEPSAIGRTMVVDSVARQIVGVMPRGFKVVDSEPDLILPLALQRSKLILAGFGLHGIARLKPGADIRQANADLTRLVPVWMDSWTNGPGLNGHVYATWKITPAIRPLKDEVIGNVGGVLWVVMATIGLVMLIACANASNLLLVRAEVRQQELAIRAALGAGWGRLVRELLLESLLLGLAGGALGIAVADGGLKLLAAIGPSNLPRLGEISIDARTLGFTFVLALLSSLLFGLIPALKYAGPRIAAALGSAGRNASISRDRHRTRNVLVIGQVALALVLLVSAGLMIRTFQSLRTVDPGFANPEHLQTLRTQLAPLEIVDALRVTRTWNAILDRLGSVAGVTSVGYGSALPVEGMVGNWDVFTAEGQKFPSGEIPPLRLYKYISPGFLHAAGTRLIAGRDLTWDEVYGLRPVALVSANLARELWGSPQAAIGKRGREFNGAPWVEVIGVVQDVYENGVQEKAPEIVYWPPFGYGIFGPSKRPESIREVVFVIRSDRAGTESFLAQVRQAVWSVNQSLPVAGAETMQQIYGRSLARTSFTLVMLGIAGSMALLIGVIGLYGVIAYGVSQRRREIGIRLALGAEPRAIRKMFLRHGLALVIVGVAVGLAAAAGLMGLMRSLLFGISPLDPITYAAVPLVLVAAALLASYLPARRAAAIDPVEALKLE
jgi:predicted permease